MWHESCHGGGIVWQMEDWDGWMDGSHHVRRDSVLGWRKDTRASSSTTILEMSHWSDMFLRLPALGVSESSVS